MSRETHERERDTHTQTYTMPNHDSLEIILIILYIFSRCTLSFIKNILIPFTSTCFSYVDSISKGFLFYRKYLFLSTLYSFINPLF